MKIKEKGSVKNLEFKGVAYSSLLQFSTYSFQRFADMNFNRFN